MKISQPVSHSVRHGRARLTALLAVFTVAGFLAVPGAASAQSTQPTSRGDCANWRSFTALNFKNRGDCVSWVNAQNHQDHGYGGGNNQGGDNNQGGNNQGGGNGGNHQNLSLANLLSRLFGFFGQILQLIGSFFGRLF